MYILLRGTRVEERRCELRKDKNQTSFLLVAKDENSSECDFRSTSLFLNRILTSVCLDKLNVVKL